MAKKAVAKAKSAPSGQISNKKSKPEKVAKPAVAKAVAKASGKAVGKVTGKIVAKSVAKSTDKSTVRPTKAAKEAPAKAVALKVVPKPEKAAAKVVKTETPLKPVPGSSLKKSEAPAKNGKAEVSPSLMSKASEPVVGESSEKDVADKTEKKAKKVKELVIDRTSDLGSQWNSLFEKSKGLKPASYKMSDNYEARTPIQHKVLGWGYVISSQNNRLEVLFKDGIKILIANYKG